jgi:hypothetical protein
MSWCSATEGLNCQERELVVRLVEAVWAGQLVLFIGVGVSSELFFLAGRDCSTGFDGRNFQGAAGAIRKPGR